MRSGPAVPAMCQMIHPVVWSEVITSGALIGCELLLHTINGPWKRGTVTGVDGQTGSPVITVRRRAQRRNRSAPWEGETEDPMIVSIDGRPLYRTWDGRYCCVVDHGIEAILIPDTWKPLPLRTVLGPD